MTPAASSGVPTRPIGCFASSRAVASARSAACSSMLSTMRLRIAAGAMALTRMLSPAWSSASDAVSAVTPLFDAL